MGKRIVVVPGEQFRSRLPPHLINLAAKVTGGGGVGPILRPLSPLGIVPNLVVTGAGENVGAVPKQSEDFTDR